MLRSLAGLIVGTVEQVLPDAVYSYRLGQITPYWEFKSHAWRDFTRKGIKIIRSGEYLGMLRTDVTSYYPSISLQILRRCLADIGCDQRAVEWIARTLGAYERQIPGIGLPIGPEGCAVLSNAFLSPLDAVLLKLQATYLRYGDDILLFAHKQKEYDRLIDEIDRQLEVLRLRRSIEKTKPFDEPDSAIENLKSGRIDYLGHLLNVEPEYGLTNVRRDFDAEVLGDADPDPSTFRWLIKTLTNKVDDHGVVPLAASPEKMNIDPRVTADYFIKTGLANKRVVAGMMDRLSGPVEDRYEGLDLHLLRAANYAVFGDAESKEFKKIAMDASRRYPIRNWALKAFMNTAGRYDELAEAARAETNPQVRRGIVVAMKGCGDRRFLDHVRRNFPESKYAADWLTAA